jgi:transposase
MPRTKPPYPPEFRGEAVRLVQSSGRPLREIATDLDVSEQTLRNWVFQAQVDAGERAGVTTDERDELRELRRRVRVLEQERDILKKAAAWFAKETGSTP